MISTDPHPTTVAEFKKIASSEEYTTPSHTDYADLARIFWENLPAHGAIHGSDVKGTLFDVDQTFWNLDRLPSILYAAGLIHGNTASNIYFGM